MDDRGESKKYSTQRAKKLRYVMPDAENTDSRPHVMAGLDSAIGYPHQCAKDAVPVSNHPTQMAGTCPACARYVSS